MKKKSLKKQLKHIAQQNAHLQFQLDSICVALSDSGQILPRWIGQDLFPLSIYDVEAIKEFRANKEEQHDF